MARFAILKKTQNLTIPCIVARASRLCFACASESVKNRSQNPYAYAYLAFVQLYGWYPKAAQTALKPALALNSNLPGIRILNGVATLMQGNLIQAWQDLQYLKKLKI